MGVGGEGRMCVWGGDEGRTLPVTREREKKQTKKCLLIFYKSIYANHEITCAADSLTQSDSAAGEPNSSVRKRNNNNNKNIAHTSILYIPPPSQWKTPG